MTEPLLRLENLCVGYTCKNRFFSDVSLTLERGELVTLFGRNGSGKSTFLRTLAGQIAPLEGGVYIEGQDISKLSAREMAHRIGYAPTRLETASYATVAEVVALSRFAHLSWWKPRTDTDHQIVANAMQQVGITDLAQKEVETLSDGERQRVLLAMVLAQETPMLLLDEPTAFLDIFAKQEIATLLAVIAHQMKRLVVCATHDWTSFLSVSDRFLWIEEKSLREVSHEQMQELFTASTTFRPENRYRHSSYNVPLAISVKKEDETV